MSQLTEAEPEVDLTDDQKLALVICVGLIKGGTGKTTSVIFIAMWLVLVKKKRVLAIDADATSQTLYTWYLIRSKAKQKVPFDVIRHHPTDDLGELLDAKRGEYDVILVDIGGGDRQAFHEANRRAALLLMPSSPSGFEHSRVNASMKAAVLAANDHIGAGLAVYVVLVRCDYRNSLAAEARVVLTEREDPYPLAENEIQYLVQYPRAWERLPNITELDQYGALMREAMKGAGVE
ncbi:ParA family protein [Kitasatospora sp. NPDC001660]